MDEIVPGLWLGDFPSALDFDALKAKGIRSVLSAMRGRVKIPETLIRHQISIDDMEDTNILEHLGPSVAFITSELGKGRGVLVHCQAGISRSSTIVAAYLMKSRRLNLEDALTIVRNARPIIDPNPGFLRQLQIFHEAGCVVSTEVPSVRRFYMERMAGQIAGSFVPQTPPEIEEQTRLDTSVSKPACLPSLSSQSSGHPQPRRRRRIRCKMCRQELATREHMLDHGQIGPQTPCSASPEPGATAATSESSDSELAATLATSTTATDSTSAAPIVTVPSILTKSACSGYFVEPLKWMNHFLDNGELSGKITCPNKRCKAKLGNYDWAGVGCGCGQWVTPGFCINRSKVDEISV